MNYFIKSFLKYKFKRQAKKKYRVVQKSDSSFEIQILQDIGINTGPIWKWTPILVDTLIDNSSKEAYIKECDILRVSYYNELLDNYIKNEEFNKRKQKYPCVVY